MTIQEEIRQPDKRGGLMKKPIVLSMIAFISLVAAFSSRPAHSQTPANPDTPTFYHLVPGTYVNGWPRFTMSYPKDWIEKRPNPFEIFRASSPGLDPHRTFGVVVGSAPWPIEKTADATVKTLGIRASEVTVLADKPSSLRDGTAAREVEVRYVLSGLPRNLLVLAVKKDGVLVQPGVESTTGKVGEDLRAILYSLEFQPGFDEPVKLPPDVQAFLDKHRNDILSHDLPKAMSSYSDGYLNSGTRKAEWERFHRQYIDTVTSFEVVVTEFHGTGDRAYLSGFVSINGAKWMSQETSIIKENGEWRWYGNQRDPAP